MRTPGPPVFGSFRRRRLPDPGLPERIGRHRGRGAKTPSPRCRRSQDTWEPATSAPSLPRPSPPSPYCAMGRSGATTRSSSSTAASDKYPPPRNLPEPPVVDPPTSISMSLHTACARATRRGIFVARTWSHRQGAKTKRCVRPGEGRRLGYSRSNSRPFRAWLAVVERNVRKCYFFPQSSSRIHSQCSNVGP